MCIQPFLINGPGSDPGAGVMLDAFNVLDNQLMGPAVSEFVNVKPVDHPDLCC